jgi:hypothetical protein
MKEIMTMSTGAMDYITDHGDWTLVTDQTGSDVIATGGMGKVIAPFYIKAVPGRDPWNKAYQASCGDTDPMSFLGTLPSGTLGGDDFVIASFGRNTTKGSIKYDYTDPEASRYNVGGMSDFDNDLVCWSGNWVIAPASVIVSGS